MVNSSVHTGILYSGISHSRDRSLVKVVFDFCVKKQAKQVLRKTAHGRLNKNHTMD